MKTILVPTDFSSTAINASEYAIQLGKQLGAEKIILYNVYQIQTAIASDPIIPVVGVFDLENIKSISESGLNNALMELKKSHPDVDIETLSEFGLLTENIDQTCKDKFVDLIVIGITGGGAIEENLFGSNTITVAKHTSVPVVIVPSKARFTTIQNIALVSDFKKVVESTPVAPIRKILDASKARIFVLNVDHSNREFDSDTPFESLMLDTLLAGYKPEYHFIDDPDFVACINDFVIDRKIDMLITIPKKHGLFDKIFKRSHTKMLAFHTHIPIMVVHE